MGLLDSAKNILAMVKKYNDIELNQQIIDLTQQSLDLINENVRLTQENEELKKANDLESRIVRHPLIEENGIHDGYPYITLSDDEQNIRYCAVCWGREQKLIQLYSNDVCMECMIKKRNK